MGLNFYNSPAFKPVTEEKKLGINFDLLNNDTYQGSIITIIL